MGRKSIIGTIVRIKDEHWTKLTSEGPVDETRYSAQIITQGGQRITLVGPEPLAETHVGDAVQIRFAFGQEAQVQTAE